MRTALRPLDRPHVVVAGLGRCGSSLMMQMLAAGGLPCIGRFPDFEVEPLNHRPVHADWLAQFPGHAMKILDPHKCAWPMQFSRRIIWMDRDPEQQARSQLKFLHLQAGIIAGRTARRAFKASYLRDRKAFKWSTSGAPWLTIRFEHVLAAPLATAERVASFLADCDLDTSRMAAAVYPRSSECRPDMRLEMLLLAQAEEIRP